jgi:hypothetical protein
MKHNLSCSKDRHLEKVGSFKIFVAAVAATLVAEI